MRIVIEIDGANVAATKLEELDSSSPLALAAVDGVYDAGQAALETGLTAEPSATSESVFDAGAANISA